MIIVRLLSPEPVGWLQHHQLYSGLGADIVMESISLVSRVGFPSLVGPLLDAGWERGPHHQTLRTTAQYAASVSRRGVLLIPNTAASERRNMPLTMATRNNITC